MPIECSADGSSYIENRSQYMAGQDEEGASSGLNLNVECYFASYLTRDLCHLLNPPSCRLLLVIRVLPHRHPFSLPPPTNPLLVLGEYL